MRDRVRIRRARDGSLVTSKGREDERAGSAPGPGQEAALRVNRVATGKGHDISQMAVYPAAENARSEEAARAGGENSNAEAVLRAKAGNAENEEALPGAELDPEQQDAAGEETVARAPAEQEAEAAEEDTAQAEQTSESAPGAPEADTSEEMPEEEKSHLPR
jgi:hypothetical protein